MQNAETEEVIDETAIETPALDEPETGIEVESPDSEESEEENVIVSIGDEAPPPEEQTHAPGWVKELRKASREKDRRIRELEAELTQNIVKKPVTVGKKPKLEDFDYDADQYESALTDWFDRKRQADIEAQRLQQAEQAQQQAWTEKLNGYGKAKAELKVKDFDDAEATVQDTLNTVQQGVVLQGAENPALVVYALGKNPKKAKELASIADPVKFAFAVAKLESQLKVTSTRKPPPPERSTPTGNAPISGSTDSTLERLRADAERTGDMTKVIRYRQQQREKQAAKR